MNLNFAIRVKFSNNLHEEDERIRGGGDVGESYIISNDLRGGEERERGGWYFLLFIVVASSFFNFLISQSFSAQK